MKKSAAVFGVLAVAGLFSAPTVFAEDKKANVMETEIVFVKNRSCNELPADLQSHSLGCEQATFGKTSYAKVKVGYGTMERQALNGEELAFQHGG